MRNVVGQPRRGAGLAEYVLIGTLCLLVSMGLIFAVGKNLTYALRGLRADMGKSASSAEVAQAVSYSQATAASANILQSQGSKSGNGKGNGLGYKLDNGMVIDMTGYPIDLKQSLQTSGANGTSKLLADTLQNVALQLAAKGQISQAQANALLALANKGHTMADIEQVIENAVGGNQLNQPVSYGGKTFDDMEVLSDQVGVVGSVDNNSEKLGPALAQFYDAYDQAKSSGALNDPAVDQLIGSLVNQISHIGYGIEDSYEKVMDGRTTTAQQLAADTYQEAQQGNALVGGGLETLDPASITHQDSATICTTGGGSDSGTSCKGSGG